MATDSYLDQFPPELAVDAAAIQRRQAIADMMRQRAMQPLQGQMAGRLYVPASPLQGVSQLGQAYFANQASRKNEADMSSLAGRYNTMMTEGVQDYMRRKYGTGVMPDPQEGEQSADFGTPAPASATGNPRGAVISAMTSRNPFLRQLGAADYKELLANEKPIVVPSDSTLTETDPVTGERRPTIVGAPKKAIPANWADNLPPGSKRLPTDPAGVFRMKGADGQEDLYALEFEGGKATGYKRLDNNWSPRQTGAVPTYHFVHTAQGTWAVNSQNPADKRLLKGPDGKPIIAAPADAAFAGDRSRQTHAGAVAGTATEGLREKLPMIEQKANAQLALIDRMIGNEAGTTKPHPGFSSYVGFTWRPGFSAIHGSKEADFKTILDQVTGGAFMQAYETLKGGGQITEIEGKKGTQALARMNKASSEAEFISAARDFQEILRTGLARAKQLAAESPIQPAAVPAGPTAPPPGFNPL